MLSTTDEIWIRQYLLGSLSADERARLEDRYLADEVFFDEFLATEHDLIDSYVREELSADEARKFEAQYFATPERRQKVEFARTLRRRASFENTSPQSSRQSPFDRLFAALSFGLRLPGWALATLILAVAASGSLLAVMDLRLRADLRRAVADLALRTQQDATRPTTPSDSGGATAGGTQGGVIARAEGPSGSIATLRLSPTQELRDATGAVRAGVSLPHGVALVRLLLELDRDDYKTYAVSLQTPDQKDVLKVNALPSQLIRGKRTIVLDVPVQDLFVGDYVIEIDGSSASGTVEPVSYYPFRIVSK